MAPRPETLSGERVGTPAAAADVALVTTAAVNRPAVPSATAVSAATLLRSRRVGGGCMSGSTSLLVVGVGQGWGPGSWAGPVGQGLCAANGSDDVGTSEA